MDGLSQWFTYKSTSARKDTSISPLSVAQAEDVRDAFAKGIYARLFGWVNGKINRSIHRPEVRKQLILLDFDLRAFLSRNFALKLWKNYRLECWTFLALKIQIWGISERQQNLHIHTYNSNFILTVSNSCA